MTCHLSHTVTVSENEDPDVTGNPRQPWASTGRQVSVLTELSKALIPMSLQYFIF